MSASKVYALSPIASFETVGDGAVILLGDSGQLYSCNDTSEAFLRNVDGQRSIDEIARLMESEYDVALETLIGDLNELAAELESEGIIVSAE
ncbi:PqqD family protein [Oricola indica]|uniref:PqqD family protein n=1 Tax=Oricola indica TaxID=2872591 RepID=UPI003CCC0C6C